METFARIYEIAWAALAIFIGIREVFYTDRVIDQQARGFDRLYAKTGLYLFKSQAEGIRKPYMWWLAKILGIFFTVWGFLMLFGYMTPWS